MVKSLLMKLEEKPKGNKRRLFINILLGFWMSAILALQLISHPPPPLLTLLEKLNLQESFKALQEIVIPFFRTTDINLDFTKKF